MKKLLLLLTIVVLSVNIYAQDTVNAQDFSENTNPDDDIVVWGYNPTTDYKIPMTTIMPFRGISGSLAIVPRYSTWNLHLGTTTPQSTYKLYTVGKGYFSDLIRAPSLYLGASSYISYSGNDLVFYDPNNGQKTLTEIITGASSIYPGSGIDKTGNTIRWDGPLTEGAVIYTGTNNVYIGDGSDKYFALYGNGYAYLHADGMLELKGTSSFKLEADSGSIEINETLNKFLITDARNVPYGLEYDQHIDNGDSLFAIPDNQTVDEKISAAIAVLPQDSNYVSAEFDTVFLDDDHNYYFTMGIYSNTITLHLNEDSIHFYDLSGAYSGSAIDVNYIMIGDSVCNADISKCIHIDDLIDGASGTGGTYDSSAVWSEADQWIHVFNADGTKWDSLLVEVDSSDAVYCATLSISSANITDGDSLQIIAAPGAGKVILVQKCIIYYDYDDANTYTSDDADYSCAFEGYQWTSNVTDNTFETATDRFYITDITNAGFGDGLDNTGVYIDFFTHTGSGTGTAKAKVYYTIADFN
jgi:hypothetical protein